MGAAHCYRLSARERQDWHRNMEVKDKSVLEKHWIADVFLTVHHSIDFKKYQLSVQLF